MDVNIFEDPLAAPPDAAPAKKRTSYDSLRMDGPGGEQGGGGLDKADTLPDENCENSMFSCPEGSHPVGNVETAVVETVRAVETQGFPTDS